MVRDITERKLNEKKVWESEKKYRELVEAANSLILTCDTAGNITFINDFGERFFGFSREELLGRNVVGTIVPPVESSGRDLAQLIGEIHRDPDRFRDNENENITKDGRRVWVRWANKEILDGQGTLVGILAIGNDITERKHAEAEKDRLAKAVSIVGEGIAITDEKDRYIYLNDAHAKLYGYMPIELMGKTWRDLAPPELVPLMARELSGTLHNRDNGVWSGECPGLSKDGTVISTEVTATARWNEKGDYLGHICVVRNISERKKAEDERAKLEAQLLQAQKMEAVGQLAGGIAHDFNNMLTTIIGYASLLEAKLGTESPLKPYVDQILNSTEKSASLTSQLLAFSRKQIMSPKETDLNELIKEMETLLKRLIGEDVEFRTCFAGTQLTAMVDKGQIEQVLLNLCTNARDAMPRGGLLAVCTDVLELDEKSKGIYELDRPGRYALIAVTDTGKGMDETTRQKIFDPFFTTKEIGKGTGLGLSIVYGIIKQHNGAITVYSEPGKGTTFKILLPLIVSTMGTAKKERLVAPRGGTETILFAEDDEAVRTLTSHVLHRAGYAVIEAVDGDDAIHKFMENRDRIKLAMLDVVMPKKSGKEVSEAIRKIRPDIRILLTSGYTADIISTRGINEEGLDFIPKPISPDTLLGKVREVLDA